MFKSIKFTMKKNKIKSPFRLKNIIFLVYLYLRKPKKEFLIKKIIVFDRYDIIKIDDFIDFKFCLRKQILINYTSFKPLSRKVSNASSKSLSGIVAEIWVRKHFYI